MKLLGIAAAIAIALAPLSVGATIPGVAQAAPCVGDGSNPRFCQECLFWVATYRLPTTRSCYESGPPPRPAQAPPSRPPVQIPPLELPPVSPAPPRQAVPAPPPPRTIPAPKINPLPPGAPRNALVTRPKGLDAPPQAVAAAKAAPATRVNPASPPKPPTPVDFNRQVQNVVNAHSGNVDVVDVDNQALTRPRHWDYIEYDDYHRPSLYNPLNQAMTFRYFYDGDYREAYVPAGGRIVLDAGAVGLFPFTAVGESYLASGSFYGGAWIPPEGWTGPPAPDFVPLTPQVYKNVSAYVPADEEAVEVGQVEVVTRDDSQPRGSQDTFLLDDSTLAWGQVNDPGSNAQIRVVKTQPLPGVGPTDNGSFLVALAPHDDAGQHAQPWWPSAVLYGVLAIAVIGVAWLISRARTAD